MRYALDGWLLNMHKHDEIDELDKHIVNMSPLAVSLTSHLAKRTQY